MAGLYKQAQAMSTPKTSSPYDSAYEALAAAIVAMACRDYIHWYRVRLSSNRKKPKAYVEGQITALQHFFRSEWCGVLCDIDPDALIESLEEEAASQNYLWRQV